MMVYHVQNELVKDYVSVTGALLLAHFSLIAHHFLGGSQWSSLADSQTAGWKDPHGEKLQLPARPPGKS